MPVLMGSEKKWRMRNRQLKLEDIEHHGYIIDFFSSLKVEAHWRIYAT